MPRSKRALADEELKAEKELEDDLDMLGFSPAEKGDFVAYKRNGEEWKCGEVTSEDGGYVTSVRHLDGFVQGIRNRVDRLIVSQHRYFEDILVILRAVDGVTDQGKISEIVSPFIVFR